MDLLAGRHSPRGRHDVLGLRGPTNSARFAFPDCWRALGSPSGWGNRLPRVAIVVIRGWLRPVPRGYSARATARWPTTPRDPTRSRWITLLDRVERVTPGHRYETATPTVQLVRRHAHTVLGRSTRIAAASATTHVTVITSPRRMAFTSARSRTRPCFRRGPHSAALGFGRRIPLVYQVRSRTGSPALHGVIDHLGARGGRRARVYVQRGRARDGRRAPALARSEAIADSAAGPSRPRRHLFWVPSKRPSPPAMAPPDPGDTRTFPHVVLLNHRRHLEDRLAPLRPTASDSCMNMDDGDGPA
jgi:hypothetical protein